MRADSASSSLSSEFGQRETAVRDGGAQDVRRDVPVRVRRPQVRPDPAGSQPSPGKTGIGTTGIIALLPNQGPRAGDPELGVRPGQTVAWRIVARPPASSATASTASRPVSPAAVRPVKKWPTPAQPCAQVTTSAAASRTVT